jgi:hypothetical protein
MHEAKHSIEWPAWSTYALLVVVVGSLATVAATLYDIW